MIKTLSFTTAAAIVLLALVGLPAAAHGQAVVSNGADRVVIDGDYVRIETLEGVTEVSGDWRRGGRTQVAHTTDDILVVQSLVAEGLGIAMMPGLVLSFLVHRKVTGRALDPASRRQVSAYVLREHLEIPTTALVLDELRTAAANRVGC